MTMRLGVRRFFGLLVAFCLLFCLCACGESDKGADRTIRIELDQAPSTVDPLLASSDGEQMVAYNIFEGLTRVSADGEVSLAAAERVEQDESGTVYTFILRESKWSDGESVRAQDFVFGLRRAVDPVTKAQAASSLYCIENAQQIALGERPISDLGVEAVDDRTLVIRLSHPYDSFLSLLSSSLTFPCREDVFNEAAGRYGMTSKTVVCNGPFTLRRWTDKVSMTLTRNSRYDGAHTARSSGVILKFDQSEDGRVERLNNKEIDFGFLSDPTGVTGDSLSLYYDFDTCYALWFHLEHPILKNETARAALAGVLDSSVVSSLPGQYRAAQGLIPESCTVGGLSYRESAGTASPLALDRAQAKADYAAAAQAKEAKAAPALTLLYEQGDAMKEIASRLAQQWQKELGAYVSLMPVSSGKLKSSLLSGEYQIALVALDSEDHSALALMRSFGSEGLTLPKDVAQQLDSLLFQAAAAEQDDARVQELGQAEQLLIDRALAVPVVDGARCYAARKVIDKVTFSFSSRVLDLAAMGKTGD